MREAGGVRRVTAAVRSLHGERAARLVVIVMIVMSVVVRLCVEVVVDAAALVVVGPRVASEVERGKDDRAKRPQKGAHKGGDPRAHRRDDSHAFEESYLRLASAAGRAMPPSICLASSA